MIENAAKMGAYFKKGLEAIQADTIKAVRGRGLMLAVEFHPEAGGARQYCLQLKEKGLLCKETHENTIRFAPPLIITKEEVDWALERIAAVLMG
jgi:ornithine--oxo-acid transaminase